LLSSHFGCIARRCFEGDASGKGSPEVGDAEEQDEEQGENEGELNEGLAPKMSLLAIPSSPQVSQ
jgi:hypothetical protein